MYWVATLDDVDFKRGPLATGDNLTAAVRAAFEGLKGETVMVRLVNAGGHIVTFSIEL